MKTSTISLITILSGAVFYWYFRRIRGRMAEDPGYGRRGDTLPSAIPGKAARDALGFTFILFVVLLLLRLIGWY